VGCSFLMQERKESCAKQGERGRGKGGEMKIIPRKGPSLWEEGRDMTNIKPKKKELSSTSPQKEKTAKRRKPIGKGHSGGGDGEGCYNGRALAFMGKAKRLDRRSGEEKESRRKENMGFTSKLRGSGLRGSRGEMSKLGVVFPV